MLHLIGLSCSSLGDSSPCVSGPDPKEPCVLQRTGMTRWEICCAKAWALGVVRQGHMLGRSPPRSQVGLFRNRTLSSQSCTHVLLTPLLYTGKRNPSTQQSDVNNVKRARGEGGPHAKADGADSAAARALDMDAFGADGLADAGMVQVLIGGTIIVTISNVNYTSWTCPIWHLLPRKHCARSFRSWMLKRRTDVQGRSPSCCHFLAAMQVF